jgi:integrase
MRDRASDSADFQKRGSAAHVQDMNDSQDLPAPEKAESSAAAPPKKTRRPQGEGGYTKPRERDGAIRGYKTINGKRVYTRWMPNMLAAAAALRGLEAAVEERTRLAAEALKPAHAETLGDAIDGYLARTELAQSTLSGYIYSKEHYLTELLALKVTDLPRKQIVKHYDRLADRGLSKATIRQAAAVLKNGLGYAFDRGWEPADTGRRIKLPKAPVRDVEGLEDNARLRLEQALVGHRYEARYLFALRYAARPAEVTGLTWRHIDFKAGTILIAGQLQYSNIRVDGVAIGPMYTTRVKTPTSRRTISPGPRIMDLLREWKLEQARELAENQPTALLLELRQKRIDRLELAKAKGLFSEPAEYHPLPADLVFTQRNGEPLTPTHDGDMWRALARRAELPSGSNLYVMRHTAITHMLASKVELLSVSLMAGHVSVAFTQARYGKGLEVPTDVRRIFSD